MRQKKHLIRIFRKYALQRSFLFFRADMLDEYIPPPSVGEMTYNLKPFTHQILSLCGYYHMDL